MSKRTAAQRATRALQVATQLKRADGTLSQVAKQAHETWIEEKKASINAHLFKELGCSAERFEVLKNTRVRGVVDGLMFGVEMYAEAPYERLSLNVECPVCKQPHLYPLMSARGTENVYERLGYWLANAEADPRCAECVESARW